MIYCTHTFFGRIVKIHDRRGTPEPLGQMEPPDPNGATGVPVAPSGSGSSLSGRLEEAGERREAHTRHSGANGYGKKLSVEGGFPPNPGTMEGPLVLATTF